MQQSLLEEQLKYLRLNSILENYNALAKQAEFFQLKTR